MLFTNTIQKETKNYPFLHAPSCRTLISQPNQFLLVEEERKEKAACNAVVLDPARQCHDSRSEWQFSDSAFSHTHTPHLIFDTNRRAPWFLILLWFSCASCLASRTMPPNAAPLFLSHPTESSLIFLAGPPPFLTLTKKIFISCHITSFSAVATRTDWTGGWTRTDE